MSFIQNNTYSVEEERYVYLNLVILDTNYNGIVFTTFKNDRLVQES